MIVGRDVYSTCAACHGGQGQGKTGPALANVLTTFASCADQVEWVSMGSDLWKVESGDRYGSNRDMPVEGGMPSFRDSFSIDEIQRVVYYERIRFGKADPETERAACGLE